MKLICVEGNIGSGKTTLAKKLSDCLNYKFIGEEFEQNPFLPLFYKNPEEFAFPLEFSFLLDRARQLNRLDSGVNYVSDYLIQKCIWFASKNLKTTDFETYAALYPRVASVAPEPGLVVFLHLPVNLLMENISSRGRVYEQEIKEDYLKALNEKYLFESLNLSANTQVLNFRLSSNTSSTYDKVVEKVIDFMKNNPRQATGPQEFKFD